MVASFSPEKARLKGKFSTMVGGAFESPLSIEQRSHTPRPDNIGTPAYQRREVFKNSPSAWSSRYRNSFRIAPGQPVFQPSTTTCG